MARPKRKSEASKGGQSSKKQKTSAEKGLFEFFDSTVKLVLSLSGSQDFLTIPSKKIVPDYTDVIKNPISLQEIKAKIKNKEYKSTDEFVADFKLMSDNCNQYNVPDCDLAKDAVKIYEFVKEQSEQFNSTLEAEEEKSVKNEEDADADAEVPEDDEDDEDYEHDKGTPAKSLPKIKIKLGAPPTPAAAATSTPIPGTPGTPSTPSGGMTQKARFLMVLDELINYDVDGQNIGKPFTFDVSRREFPDYYKIIKKPMSLNTVKENILAGKVKSMGQFQNQVELVWKNAQTYNEPNTLLYSDSRVLQDFFHERMAAINKEIEAARVALLQQRDTPSGLQSVRLKIKPPKTKLSLTLHNRGGQLPIPGELGGSNLLNPLTGEPVKEESENGSDSEEEDSNSEIDESEDEDNATPAVMLPSTKPRDFSHSAEDAYIQEITIGSSKSLYKQLLRPMASQAVPIQSTQDWFEHRFLACDFPVTSYTIMLQRHQGAVSVSAGLNDALVKKKHQAFLTVNGERVNPVPSIHYADSGRLLTSRYELKLPLGLNMVVFDVAVEDGTEESRTRAQEAANLKTEKLTFWIQVL